MCVRTGKPVHRYTVSKQLVRQLILSACSYTGTLPDCCTLAAPEWRCLGMVSITQLSQSCPQKHQTGHVPLSLQISMSVRARVTGVPLSSGIMWVAPPAR